MRFTWTTFGVAAGLAVTLSAAPAVAGDARQSAGDKAASAADRAAGKVDDSVILTKVKARITAEDGLDDSKINVDVKKGIVTLRGRVASGGDRLKAVELARDTDGVVRVVDRLAVGTASAQSANDSVGTSGRTATAKADTDHAAAEARESGRSAKESAKEAGKATGRAAKDAASETGEAISDGSITTKVKTSFVNVASLDGSDINVDTDNHVVTLRGTVASAAGRLEAARIAKGIKGVHSVRNELVVGPEK